MAAIYRQSLVWMAPFLRDSVSLVTDEGRAEFMHALGTTILALRVERGPGLEIYNQTDLANAIGVSAATVLRWENGKGAPPDAWEIRELCRVFAVEPAELIRPEPISDRERQVLRRAGRQLRRTIDREREDS